MSLGGGGGGGQPQTSTTVTTQELSPEQRAILKPLIPIITKFGETPLEQFPGSLIPDFNPLELQAQQTALTAAGGIQQDVGQASAFANFLQGPALFPQTNPALQANIEAAIRPLTETFGQTILPNIRGQEVIAGQVGGSRGMLAEQQATNLLLRQVGETSAGLVGENFANALRAGTQSLFAQPSLLSSSLLPAQVIAGVGGAERGLTTAQLEEEAARFGAEQLKVFAPAQAAAGVAFGMPGGTVMSKGTAFGGGGGGNIFGTAMGAGSLGAAMFPGNPLVGGGLGILAGLLFG